jgi:hypothetical protein
LIEGLIIVLVITSGLLISSIVYEKPIDPQIELVNWRVYQSINGTGTVWQFNETYEGKTHHTFNSELLENWTYVQFSVSNPYPYNFEATLYLNATWVSFSCWSSPKGSRLRLVKETTLGFHLIGVYNDLLTYNLTIKLKSNKGSVTIHV